tara:strand:+ start:12172 stop:13911 length:1740 start_codon:yes stop_codon:yes gene_type:complete
MYFLNLFLFNLLFNTFFIQKLFTNNEAIATNNLINLQNDFARIQFPYSFSVNFLFVSTVITIFLTIIFYYFIPKRISISSPEQILKEIIKVFIIYSFVLFSVMYLFRLYDFSRSLIIFGIIFYTFFAYILIWLFRQLISSNRYLNVVFSIFIFVGFLGFLASLREDNPEPISVESVTTSTTTTLFSPLISETECSEWVGSTNYSGCISNVKITSSLYVSESLNNIIVNKLDVYLLDVYGRVYKNTPDNVFLDLSPKILNRFEYPYESGLFSLAFHPEQEYFLVSYSDLDNNLIVEKFLIVDNLPELETSEVLIKIPNSSCCHYSGNIIWSNFFEDFILSVGDMEASGLWEDQKTNIKFNSEPLDTTSPRGKVLLLNKLISNPPKLATENSSIPKKNIIAYGLRNPWKTYEYKNYLFVPDVGESRQEELNVLDLNLILQSNKPYLLGWPYFEGVLDNEITFNEILIHTEQGESQSINNYIYENSLSPILYYEHQGTQNYRAALIGGEVLDSPESNYHQNYFFADYISGELFSYDFINDKLYIMPLPTIDSYITSLAIHPTKFNTLLISTGSGNLLDITLP